MSPDVVHMLSEISGTGYYECSERQHHDLWSTQHSHIWWDVLACNIETSPGCYLQYCFDFVVILERGSGWLNQECCAHDASMLHAWNSNNPHCLSNKQKTSEEHVNNSMCDHAIWW